ncbi:polysaccharide deacetylase family sporulation protein PdaB [Anaerospora hongkongensis]|uniref:Polysaccharide deacetylase family sporulation protein PdaB n=1 Tax=Anaerospora hongkongensis TaxID=244830 RepID=A0A4V2Q8L1_9FIRM|nr:polysaccharide deacetylase family protein [Anaerospora hongkongensis]TCL37182.1 polysaccharide deacetylase family sporulation protein PdaB [Anaerospora hongkongensis]
MLDTPIRLTTLLEIATILVLIALFLDYSHILRRPWRPALILAIVTICVGTYLTLSAVLPTSSFYGPVIYQGSQSDKVVALTFDDGPNPPYTLQLLDILTTYDVKATFFLIGQNAEKYPETANAIAQKGHLIGTHTYTHSDLLKLAETDILKELSQSAVVIENATGTRPKFLRPPHGFRDSLVLQFSKEQKLDIVQWSVMAEDWKKPGADVIANRVLNKINNGSIVLLHDGDGIIGGDRSQTVAAAEIIIKKLRQRGFRFVTVKELLN